MRTTSGASDRVVVVGAGLAGLSAALHLAGRGRAVTVIERDEHPGGRVGRLDHAGFHLDTGPTVLTMPGIIADTLGAVGARLEDHLDLVPVHPAYRTHFADGTTLDVHTEADAMAEAVRAFAGPAEADGYRRLRAWLTRLYELEIGRFIGANIDSPLTVVSADLARLAAAGGFRRLDRMIGRFLHDPRLQRVFSFQALYAGQNPARALALYGVIAYMDTVAGVWFPRGGMRAVPDALAAAAAGAGVTFLYGRHVTELEKRGDRVTAVITADGLRVPADAVVLTTELAESYRLLGRAPRRVLPLRPAPSAVVLHLGVHALPTDVAHHSIVFGEAWDETFRDIIDRGLPMTDPSLLVTRPTASDPGLAPEGRDLLYVLAPAPNLTRGRVDWDRAGPGYADELVAAVEKRLIPGLAGMIETSRLVTPADWARRGHLAGTPFALAHTVGQTGPFRPGNLPRGCANAVLAGGSTTPGVGVPTALLSGRLAADRITGVVEDRFRRAVIA